MSIVMHKRLLNTKEAAAYLSIGKSTLCLWVSKGKIPSIKIEGIRRFDVDDLDRFVEKIKEGNQIK